MYEIDETYKRRREVNIKQVVYTALAAGILTMELAILVAAIKWVFWLGVFLFGLAIVVNVLLIIWIGAEEGLW